MNLKNKKLIMLDFDGTIARVLDLYNLEKVKQKLISKLNNLSLNFDDKYECFDVFGYCNNIRDEKIRLQALEISHNIVSEAEMEAVKTSIEVDGFRQFLDYVDENNIKIAISTSNCKECVYKYFMDNNINYNIMVIGREMYEVDKLKPNSWSLEHLLKEFNIKKEDALYIGDNPSDFLCAKATKVDFIGMAPTEKKRNRFINFNKEILFYNNYYELLEDIKK